MKDGKDNSKPPIARFLTVKQVAAELQISPWLVRQIIARGELRAHRVGGNVLRVSREQLDSYLQSVAQLPTRKGR